MFLNAIKLGSTGQDEAKIYILITINAFFFFIMSTSYTTGCLWFAPPFPPSVALFTQLLSACYLHTLCKHFFLLAAYLLCSR